MAHNLLVSGNPALTSTFLSAPQLTALPVNGARMNSSLSFLNMLLGPVPSFPPSLLAASFSQHLCLSRIHPHTPGWWPVNCVTTPFNLLFPCSKASHAFPFLPTHSGSQNFLQPKRVQKQPYEYIKFLSMIKEVFKIREDFIIRKTSLQLE